MDFLTRTSRGVQEGFLQGFYYCQCCRLTCPNLKNTSTLLQRDFPHLSLLSRTSPLLQDVV